MQRSTVRPEKQRLGKEEGERDEGEEGRAQRWTELQQAPSGPGLHRASILEGGCMWEAERPRGATGKIPGPWRPACADSGRGKVEPFPSLIATRAICLRKWRNHPAVPPDEPDMSLAKASPLWERGSTSTPYSRASSTSSTFRPSIRRYSGVLPRGRVATAATGPMPVSRLLASIGSGLRSQVNRWSCHIAIK